MFMMSKAKPVIIKKNLIINDKKLLQTCFNNITQEDIIYKATTGDFLEGKYPNLVLTNRLNKINNFSRTVATFSTTNSSKVVLSSDSITRVLGQKNYDTVFTALCSVINQKLKIQGILSLLTPDKVEDPKSNNIVSDGIPNKRNTSVQTDQSCMYMLLKAKSLKNNRRTRPRPYVIKDSHANIVKKVIVNPNEVRLNGEFIKSELKSNTVTDNTLPDLKVYIDEESNISTASSGAFSLSSNINIPISILENPEMVLNSIHNCTENNYIDLVDGSKLRLNYKVEDKFHLVRKESMSGLSEQDQKKLIELQAYIDFKYCLVHDEDGNLPLHNAVVENDINLVNRHCIMLKKRDETVDVLSYNNLTSLQMSILRDVPSCTKLLLEHGADAILPDEDGRTAFHIAAEVQSEHLASLIEFYKKNARQILKENEDLWEDNMEFKSDDRLSEFLLHYIGIACDSQGFTPLMLASKLGLHTNVKLLVDAGPDTINKEMPNSGNTALYLAVEAACMDVDNRGNKSSVADNFLKTIETLIVNGADPYLVNNYGNSVNDILSECNIASLSLLIANKITSLKYFNGNEAKNFDSYMLLKSKDGRLDFTLISNKANRNSQEIATNNINDTRNVDKEKKATLATSQNTQMKNNEKEGRETVTVLNNIPVVTKRQVDPITLKKKIIVFKSVETMNARSNTTASKGTKAIPNRLGGSDSPDVEPKASVSKIAKRVTDVDLGAVCSKRKK